MRPAALLLLAALCAGPAVAAEPTPLARARTLYNAADYDGAIAAATEARREGDAADAAALVLARAHLERYRQRMDPQDLGAAREALQAVRPDALTPRDRVDLLVGLGQSLFLAEQFGAAAELFESALGGAPLLSARGRVLLLDWWASALDREAQTRPPAERERLFVRIGDRMQREVETDPGSGPAAYWLAVAARGAGDIERAWDAAVAGWVRASLNPETAASVRADLDRLVTQALIPERVRARASSPRDQQELAARLRAEWDAFKGGWK